MWVNSTVRAAQRYTAISTPAYDWNVSVSLGGSPTGWAVGTISGGANNNYLIVPGKYVLFVQGTFGAHVGMSATITAVVTTNPANITAISLQPQTLGQTLWSRSYPQAPGNVTRTIMGMDPTTGILMFEDKETFVHWGYSLSTGLQVWGPTITYPTAANAWNYLSLDNDYIYQGLLIYQSGYSGVLYSYNDSTGALVYTWGNGGEGNTTNSGLYTAFGVYPLWVSTMADGKLYLQGDVHSPNTPLWKGQQMYALDAATGKQLWSIFNYAQNMYGGIAPVASGYLVAFNAYDSQLYTFGQGPSVTTVTAPDAAIPIGTPLVIKGTVMDISAGTQQETQKANFPNGVPAVSDASQSAWMEYVYMQKPRPTNITGVPVQITITDPNGKTYGVSAISVDLGNYAAEWTPPVSKLCKVIATFAGSYSYYGSVAGTAFDAMQAASQSVPTATAAPSIAPTTTPTTASSATTTPTTAPSPTSGIATETYIAIAAVVVMIVVVAAALVLRRRK